MSRSCELLINHTTLLTVLLTMTGTLFLQGCGGGGDSSPFIGSATTIGSGGTGGGNQPGAGTPLITSITPAVAAAGDLVTIQGQGLTGVTANSSNSNLAMLAEPAMSRPVVAFGLEAATPLSSSSTSLVVTVPEGLTTGMLTVSIGTARSNALSFLDGAPEVISVPPSQAEVGTQYVYRVKAQDAFDRPVTFSLSNGPPGLSVNEISGEVAWTPAIDQTGVRLIDIRANNGQRTTTHRWKVLVSGSRPEASGTFTSGQSLTLSITRSDSPMKGSRIVVPAGATLATVNITVSTLIGSPAFSGPGALHIEPDGTEFQQPVRVELPITESLLHSMGATTPADLALVSLGNSGHKSEQLKNIQVDLSSQVISGTTTHFTDIGYSVDERILSTIVALSGTRLLDHFDARARERAYQHYELVSVKSQGDLVPLRPGKRNCVLLHGIFSKDDEFDSVKEFAKQNYDHVVFFNYPSAHRVKYHALALLEALVVDENAEFDVIAHSLGGLVARTAILLDFGRFSGRFKSGIRRILTLDTPHRGSRLGVITACAAVPLGIESMEDLIDLDDLTSAYGCPDVPAPFMPITLILQSQRYDTPGSTICLRAVSGGVIPDGPFREAGSEFVTQRSAFGVPGLVIGVDTFPFATQSHSGVHENIVQLSDILTVWGFGVRASPRLVEIPVGASMTVRILRELDGPPDVIGDPATTNQQGDVFSFTWDRDHHGVTVTGTRPGKDALRLMVRGCITTVPVTVLAPNITISKVVPNQGALDGGTSITLSGTNFVNITGVTIDGVATTALDVKSSTELKCVTPSSASTGAKVVAISSSSFGEAQLTDGFMYNPRMQITSVIPSGGTTAGGTAISISGLNFFNVSDIRIGEGRATQVVASSATELTCLSPSSATFGQRDITIFSSTHGSANKVEAFTYVAPGNSPPDAPTVTSPADGATATFVNPTLESSPCTDPEGDPHNNSTWEIHDSGDLDSLSLVWSAIADPIHLTSISVNSANGSFVHGLNGKAALLQGHRYWVRVRYVDGRGATSLFSSPNNFTTIGPPLTWRQLTLGSAPSSRYGHAMAADVAHQNLILFGGETGTPEILDDTWELGESGWTKRTPSSSPTARRQLTLSYDSLRRKIVLFGGANIGASRFSEIWEWDGTTWTQAAPTLSPSSRVDPASAFDEAHGELVMFGGYDGTYGGTNDTWQWNGLRWLQQLPVSSPLPRYTHAMT